MCWRLMGELEKQGVELKKQMAPNPVAVKAQVEGGA